jgi:hypothetical protein
LCQPTGWRTFTMRIAVTTRIGCMGSRDERGKPPAGRDQRDDVDLPRGASRGELVVVGGHRGVAGEAQNVYRLQRAETRTGAGLFARYEPSSVSARRRACHPATNLSTSSAGMEKG